MPNIKPVKIFIASSNELIDERKLCIQIITQLNESHKHLHLQPFGWEISMVHSNYPLYEDIQDAIDPKLKESDLVIFIFHSKIGKYTREEFEFANNENKRLFAYFKKGFSPEEEEELKNYGELIKFKKSLNDTVLYNDYDDLDNFEKLFYPNLNLYLTENHSATNDDTDRITVTALSQSNQQLIQLLAAKEEEIKNLRENVNQLPDVALQVQINELLQEKDDIRNELLQSEEVKKQLAKDKEALEKQLAPQIEHDILKAKALEEIKNENYPKAEKYLRESAKASVKETASTFFELAKIKNLQLQYSEALNFYELAAKIESDNSHYLNEAGLMANNMGFYNRAIEFHEKAIIIDKKIHGQNHPDIDMSYNNIGMAYSSKGEYDKAIEYYKISLGFGEEFNNDSNPDFATRYNNIGVAYNDKGEYDKAIEYYEKALIIDKKFHGEEHLDIAVDYNNLGSVYSDKGEYDKAIEYYEKALIIDKKFHGEEHPDIAIDYGNTGSAYRNKKEFRKAIEYYEKALIIGKKFYGEVHPSIAVRYNNIGLTYSDLGEYNKAIEYYEKALIIDKKFHGEEHPQIAIRYNNIGVIYSKKLEYTKAIEYLQKALYINSKYLPTNHPNIKACIKNIEISKEKQKKSKKF